MALTILIAGFQHETNTFAPSKAAYANFEQGEGFPPMVRGEAVLALREVNIPAGGFIRAAQEAGDRLRPVIWAGASPSAHVTRSAFEKIAGEIVVAARQRNVDAVYLDLHGAMVAEHVDDGEGELLERVRAAVGATIPIVASLDLHANVTARMLAVADALVAYRTYPHVDMADTGARAYRLLRQLMAPGIVYRASRRLPFLIPVNAMCTLIEPARSTYAMLGMLETGDVVSASFTPGFPAADFPECGPVVWAYGHNQQEAQQAVDTLYDRLVQHETTWTVRFLSPDEAVLEAWRAAQHATRPVVIADTQDNPGAGGDADTMGMLRALLRHHVRDAAFGLVWDPQAARAAHDAGVGASIDLALGGRSGTPGDAPFQGRFEVVALSDGRCRYDGPMMNGMNAFLGPVACLRIEGVLVAVSSVKAQMLDRNLYRVAGIQPENMKILVNKSSVHFRADFDPIAEAIFVAKAPGPMVADPGDLPWRRLASGMRTSPGGIAFSNPS